MGLIQNSMQDPGQAAQPGMPPQPMPPQSMPNQQQMGVDDAGPESSDDSPEYQAAVQLMMKALYSDKAAMDVAKALRGARDLAGALADTTYNMISIVDERTEGSVPDDLLMTLAAEAMTEVVEIAEAAGIKIGGQDIASAMRQMITRFVGENGGDATDLKVAMDGLGGKVGNVLDISRNELDGQAPEAQ